MLDRTKLADRAIGGAEHRAWGLVQRARAIFEGAGEEGVEVLVGGHVFDQRLGHVYLVAFGEPGGESVLEPTHAALGNAASEARQQMVRQQVLAEDKQLLFH